MISLKPINRLQGKILKCQNIRMHSLRVEQQKRIIINSLFVTKNVQNILVQKLKERGHFENLEIDGKITLKCI